ncbi:MAG: 3'(2'),5'-bisphosphate nucleotidase CysQ [Leptospiraceae bacterium]|nr:3'(2'),5'-bisphosphate nucleotidase CysQ [Leptospiraceae bacterium]MCP5497936.1 3'(2'),5'-bisphosphate nucleotidase CysQ [Leptospiraceae bacterium]
MDLKKNLEIAKVTSAIAGKAILEVYETGDFEIETKADDSPLTKADKKSHGIIFQSLQETNIPILSEEGLDIPYSERRKWEYFWLVDPLDGTKEFIKKNGEFTVNIALVQNGKPILGVVYIPVLEKLYYGLKDMGAFLEENGNVTKLPFNKNETDTVRIVASRNYLNDETKKFINLYPKQELLSLGSSLKFMLLAEGNADVYPRLAPTSEWDTAASQAIVEITGGKIINFATKENLTYNKENLINPFFIAYRENKYDLNLV